MSMFWRMPWSTRRGTSIRVPGQPSCCAALALALVVASNLSCQRGGAKAAGPLAIVISGDTAGWIVPCGCASNQSGGLLRRGSYLSGLREEADVLLLDAGGAAAGASPYDQAKFEAIVRGELQMGLRAHNLGASEVGFGAKYLRDLTRTLKPPFVSCNVRNSEGELLVAPTIHVEIAARRIAVIGVLSPQFQSGSLQIAPPLTALLEMLDRNVAPYDHLVVLAYLPDDELRDLAAQLPEADLIVGGPTGQSIVPERLGTTWLASATTKGKFLVELRADGADASEWKGRVIEMNDSFPDDPRQWQNLEQFYATLDQRDFTPQETEFSKLLPGLAVPEDRVAGTIRCGQCHARDYHDWEHSAHAHAWESLRNTGAHVDPYCQQCHTTAYGWPGGFESVRHSLSLVNVGCETCHGLSQDHAQDPQIATTHFQQASQQCLHCHDRENSPQFAYDPYWSKIRHGMAAALQQPRDEQALGKEPG